MRRSLACVVLTLLVVSAAHGQKMIVIGGRMGGHSTEVTGVAFLPDGKTVVSAHANAGLQFHDSATGKKLADLAVPGPGVLAVAVAPDGKTLATAGVDHVVRLWDVQTRNLHKALPVHQAPASAVAFSADGKLFAS